MKPTAGLGAREADVASSHVRSVATEPLAPRPALAPDRMDKAPVPSVVHAGIVSRMKESVWLPVVGKATAILLGMLALAGVGAWSTLQGAGVPLAMASGTPPATPPPSASVPTVEPAAARSPSSPATESPAAPSVPASSAAPPPVSGVTADGRVILNVATADELTRLPRVGPKRAENIVALRKKLGRFKQPTDLLRVKGIGRKTLQLMLPKLVLNSPEPPAPPKPEAATASPSGSTAAAR